MTPDAKTEEPASVSGVDAPTPVPVAVEAPRRRRRRRGRDRREERSGALLIAAVFCSGLGLGGLHWTTLVASAALAIAAGVFALGVLPGRVLPGPALVPLALSAYTLLQVVPIPLSLLRVLSPAMAEVWAGALTPFDENPM